MIRSLHAPSRWMCVGVAGSPAMGAVIMMLVTNVLRRTARTGIRAVGSLCVLIAIGATTPEAAAVGAPRAVVTSPATTITGRVRLSDGAPVRNAVVVTSLGGRGVSRGDGSFAFDVDVVRPDSPLHVTAVASIGGVNYAGSLVTPTADVGAITLAAGAQCEPSWLPTFGSEPGVNGTVYALTTFDDGSGKGPELYAGGTFTSAGGIAAKYIARWDGTAWSALAGGTSDKVNAFANLDDGSGSGPALFAGGVFTVSPAGDSYLARWQGCPLDVPADLNDDGAVNATDLGILLGGWGLAGISDLNGDLTTDSVDLGILLGAWTG